MSGILWGYPGKRNYTTLELISGVDVEANTAELQAAVIDTSIMILKMALQAMVDTEPIYENDCLETICIYCGHINNGKHAKDCVWACARSALA